MKDLIKSILILLILIAVNNLCIWIVVSNTTWVEYRDILGVIALVTAFIERDIFMLGEKIEKLTEVTQKEDIDNKLNKIIREND